MRRLLTTIVLCAVMLAIGGGAAFYALKMRRSPLPDPPALVTQIREVARLETLDVTLYKKVSFEPDPQPSATLLGDALTWAKFTLRPPKGKAVVFAEAHLGLDMSKLNADHVKVVGDVVEVVLPPIQTKIELRPGDTEVIGSNLDSQQTAQLLELAKEAFLLEVDRDPHYKAKARASAEKALRALLLTTGFKEVRFVEALTPDQRG